MRFLDLRNVFVRPNRQGKQRFLVALALKGFRFQEGIDEGENGLLLEWIQFANPLPQLLSRYDLLHVLITS
ncbi:MAG TPA: hypothetical protein PLF37_14040 [Planctomycetota bacterium]|nr:hypothetical protein [Planctomycetota bacterium]